MTAGHARLFAFALLVATPLWALDQTLVDLEAALRRSTSARLTIAEERASALAEASVLADEISRLKSRTDDQARAGDELESRLQQFDRVVATLDKLQAALDARDREIARLKSAFDLAVSAALQRLASRDAGSATDVAVRQREIEETKRRVEALGISTRGFRPVLSVALNANDGPLEISQKITIVDSERQRVTTEIARLDREMEVVTTRVTLQKQLRDQLDAAIRAQSGDQDLLQRESDRASSVVVELGRQRNELTRQRAVLGRTLGDLTSKVEQFRKRQAELLRRPGGSGGL